MGAGVRRYEVTEECYVPVGPGLKYKKPGQVVTLHDDDAAELAGFITPVSESAGPVWTERFPKTAGGVAKRNTSPKTKTAEAEEASPAEEVTSDASEPVPADERAGGEAPE